MSLRDIMLKPVAVPQQEVPVPELGCTVHVYGMTGGQKSRFELSLQTNGKKSNRKMQTFRERLMIQCCRDETGAPIFQDSDIEALSDMPAKIVERIVDVAMDLSGMNGADLEELVGNSEDSQSDS